MRPFSTAALQRNGLSLFSADISFASECFSFAPDRVRFGLLIVVLGMT